jgi:single-strand DNA-binding protein
MRSVNKVIVIGNLTRDPVVKSTPDGVTKFFTAGVATNRNVVTKSGEKKQLTEFIEICTFTPWIVRLADQGALKKGKYIYCEGYMKTRYWDDDQGKRSYRTEVIVNDLIMLDKRPARDEVAHVSTAEADVVVNPVPTDMIVEEAQVKAEEEDLF